MKTSSAAQNIEQQLIEDMASFEFNPLDFVYYAYPWGKEGTWLEHWQGPDKWQTKTLLRIGELMQENAATGAPTRILRRSGNEVGKTALIAWVIQFFLSTRPNCAGVATANTKTQLESKTWREVKRWHDIVINKHWFEWTATRYACVSNKPGWGISAIPWTKERAQAFAGTHEKQGVLFVFDEGSIIANEIYDVVDPSMDAGSLWLVFGNPTHNTGRFHESAVGRLRHRWDSDQIDARDSAISNKVKIQQWIEDYGISSDYVKVHVLGEFPSASSLQFIPSDLVNAAAARRVHPHQYDRVARIMGIDVARFGDDQSVILKRTGGVVFDIQRYRGLDDLAVASHAAHAARQFNPDAIFVDGTGGYGGGVISRLKEMGFPVLEVQFANSSPSPEYANKRAYIWGQMKEWLKWGSIPNDEDLKADLIGPEYGFKIVGGREAILLEAKEDMKSRGLASPDAGDALACTFSEPVLSEYERSVTGVHGIKDAGVGGHNTITQDIIQKARNRMRRK